MCRCVCVRAAKQGGAARSSGAVGALVDAISSTAVSQLHRHMHVRTHARARTHTSPSTHHTRTQHCPRHAHHTHTHTHTHPQALPSLAEVMYNQFKSKKEALSSTNKADVLAKYGNEGERECACACACACVRARARARARVRVCVCVCVLSRHVCTLLTKVACTPFAHARSWRTPPPKENTPPHTP
jgi:hypothetical protein